MLRVGSGCAILRGGAAHPSWMPSAATLSEGLLRIPIEEIDRVGAGKVLHVKPGQPYPEVLVTRVADGSFRVVLADCAHAGCTVDWDAGPREWACPCHGSRYAEDGRLLRGPALDPLFAPPHQVVEGALEIPLASIKGR